MKNLLANRLCAVFIVIGVLLLELGTPVPGLGEALWDGSVTANVNLRKTPSLQGEILAGLLQGSEVKIYEEKEGWYQVSTKKYHQVFNGWVSIEYVKIAVVETPATLPGTEEPEPSGLAQSPPSVEARDPSAPSAAPEKPLPTPVEKSPPPEAKAPAVSPEPDKPAVAEPPKAKSVDSKTEPPPRTAKTPEPEPDKRTATQAPKTKMADTKTERPPRVAKTPVPAAVTEPADDLIRLLPTALPVLAVIVLLIVVIVYRSRRASRQKAEIPDSPAEPAPTVWPPPPAENSVAFEEIESIKEDPPAAFEFQMESMPEDRTSGDNGDGPTEAASVGNDGDSSTEVVSVNDDGDSPAEVVSVSDDGDSSTEIVSVSDDGDSPTEIVSVSDDTDSPTKDVSVYDLIMEKINRMSDVELVELLDLVDDQLGEQSRKDDRMIFHTMADYVVEGQYYRDFIQDLSVSGVFIKTRQMFESGQHILMTFMSPFLQKPFKISGEIVRTLDTGIGVKFDQESQVQPEAISALMDQIRMLEES